MIQMLRTEAISGAIDDLAHVVSVDCMADCLTQASAKADYLIKAVDGGTLPNVDRHPPFREIMQGRHKAYPTVAHWIIENLPASADVVAFLGQHCQREIQVLLSCTDWYNVSLPTP